MRFWAEVEAHCGRLATTVIWRDPQECIVLGFVRRVLQSRQEHAAHLRQERAALLAPLRGTPPGEFSAPIIRFPELREVLRAGGPKLPPYHGLADFWDMYAANVLPDYPTYITARARRCGRPVGAVLDLACGTGALSVKLARLAAEVVGLDTSESMLAVARSRADCPGMDFVLGDMREFDIARRFDVAVCASNSMNYTADGSELERVLSAVARHLQPGGFFVFDAVTDQGMRLHAGEWLHVDVGGRKLVMRSEYDPAARREKTQVVLTSGIEMHHRSPIDRADVAYAAFGTGLTLVEQFSATFPFGSSDPGWLGFHVLEKKG